MPSWSGIGRYPRLVQRGVQWSLVETATPSGIGVMSSMLVRRDRSCVTHTLAPESAIDFPVGVIIGESEDGWRVRDIPMMVIGMSPWDVYGKVVSKWGGSMLCAMSKGYMGHGEDGSNVSSSDEGWSVFQAMREV